MKRFTMRQRAGGAMVGALLACAATLVVLPGSGASAAPITVATVCNASGAFTPKGNNLVSGPMVAALQTTPVPLSFAGDATATPTINPGGTVTYHVTLDVHPQALAQDTLDNSVGPALLADATGKNYWNANRTALNLRIANLKVNLPVPGLTNYTGTIAASTSAGGPSVAATADGTGVNFTLGPITANAAQSDPIATSTTMTTADFTITLDFTAVATTAVAGDVITLHPGDMSFDFEGPDANHGGFNVSIWTAVGGRTEVSGGANGHEVCDTTDSVLASTNVVASTNTTTTTSTTTTTEPSTTTTTTEPSTTTTSTTTTTAPTTTTTSTTEPSTTTTTTEPSTTTTTTEPSTTTTSTTEPSTTTTTTEPTTTTTTTTAPTTTTTTTTTTAPTTTTTTTAPTTTTTAPTTTTTTAPTTTTTTAPTSTTTTRPGETTTTTTAPATTSTTLTPGIPGDTGSTVPDTTSSTTTSPEVTDTTSPEVTDTTVGDPGDPGTTATTDGNGVLGDNGNQGTGGTGLARTGTEILPLAGFGAMLLLLGAAFLRRSRRQES